jgi:hypothetical protein
MVQTFVTKFEIVPLTTSTMAPFATGDAGRVMVVEFAGWAVMIRSATLFGTARLAAMVLVMTVCELVTSPEQMKVDGPPGPCPAFQHSLPVSVFWVTGCARAGAASAATASARRSLRISC